jgi:D-glycero-alpha-D-manno-heptose 1-phosphate guanylyltransferase
MIKETIILAGGLGTRLRSAVPDLPKCMAPVNGKPFLYYVITHLQKQGINKFIFSLGYKSEVIVAYLNELSIINYQLSIEKEPLGTGGAIQFAASKATEKSVLILNGDTLFSINVETISALHELKDADCTLSLKPMQDFNRYGVVELNNDASVSSFKEKQYYKTGLINGGVYALNTESFLREGLPEKFSFEKDYLEQYYNKRKIYGIVQDEYFIDIGIPEDFERAQKELIINN